VKDYYFSGPVIAEWPEDEVRDIIIYKQLAFYTPAHVWVVPEGAVVNGASFPVFLWSTGNSPFIGKYRRSAVFHDHYCNVRTEPWESVHFMFYMAMLCDGVNKEKALLMYHAVRTFGPRWDEHGDSLLYEPCEQWEEDLVLDYVGG